MPRALRKAPGARTARSAWRALRRADVRKSQGELGYWRARAAEEGRLGNAHFEHFYTAHFGLDRDFYRGKAVLDVGCGPRGSLEWADMAAERVGLDPLADSYRELGVDDHSMRYVAGEAERMPFPARSFDVVASFNSLDHVDDLEGCVREIKRVLRPGGLFLLLTELGHDLTWEEPQDFSWEVLELFAPELELVEERHLERVVPGLYESVREAVPYDHDRPGERTGVLSAKLRRTSS